MSEQIAHLEDLLGAPEEDPGAHSGSISRDLAEKYGDDRRTRIAAEAKEELSEADLVQDEAVLISLTERGYIKRVAASAVPLAEPRRTRGDGSHAPRTKMRSSC